MYNNGPVDKGGEYIRSMVECNLRWPAATDALLSGRIDPLGGRSGHREMAPGSRFPIL